MKVAIGADHGGFELKEIIKTLVETLGHIVEDTGCYSTESVDYPTFAAQVSQLVNDGKCDMGILICGTGIGMSMAANRYQHVRAALCSEQFSAQMSREHNNANILCLGARVIGSGIAEEIVTTWLSTEFAGGRHQRRIEKFSD